jgi:hypothetical protein
MSFQLTFLGYYSIKSPQLKKQTHSVKRRNWSHRERTALGGRGSRPPSSDGLGGRPRRPADGRQGGRPWDRRTRLDVRRTRPWTSGRVTTLGQTGWPDGEPDGVARRGGQTGSQTGWPDRWPDGVARRGARRGQTGAMSSATSFLNAMSPV